MSGPRRKRRKKKPPFRFTAEMLFGTLSATPATLRQYDRIHALRVELGRPDPSEIPTMTLGRAWDVIGDLGVEVEKRHQPTGGHHA